VWRSVLKRCPRVQWSSINPHLSSPGTHAVATSRFGQVCAHECQRRRQGGDGLRLRRGAHIGREQRPGAAARRRGTDRARGRQRGLQHLVRQRARWGTVALGTCARCGAPSARADRCHAGCQHHACQLAAGRDVSHASCIINLWRLLFFRNRRVYYSQLARINLGTAHTITSNNHANNQLKPGTAVRDTQTTQSVEPG
jgi:hypothetical protein